MARRTSISSDVSSALSDATTLQPGIKDSSSGSSGSSSTDTKANGKQQRRGLRQKARDVLSDMGSPPTARHDAKEGKPVKNYADLGLLGSVVTARPAHT
jgi:hypothetical protein